MDSPDSTATTTDAKLLATAGTTGQLRSATLAAFMSNEAACNRRLIPDRLPNSCACNLIWFELNAWVDRSSAAAREKCLERLREDVLDCCIKDLGDRCIALMQARRFGDARRCSDQMKALILSRSVGHVHRLETERGLTCLLDKAPNPGHPHPPSARR